MYPPIEPYRHGMLDVGHGNLLHWEECGNPEGKPALVLHGGPGSGATPGWRRYFDPARYRVVLFDQRNCGRSTPHAADPATDLTTNTTGHLLSDIEALAHAWPGCELIMIDEAGHETETAGMGSTLVAQLDRFASS
jgi:proline iminopeptidase